MMVMVIDASMQQQFRRAAASLAYVYMPLKPKQAAFAMNVDKYTY